MCYFELDTDLWLCCALGRDQFKEIQITWERLPSIFGKASVNFGLVQATLES